MPVVLTNPTPLFSPGKEKAAPYKRRRNMNRRIGLVLILLVTLMSACSFGNAGGAVIPPTEQPVQPAPTEEIAPAEPTAAEAPVEEAPAAEEPAAETFELPPFVETNGGFNAPYREVNDLPSLPMPVGGAMPPACEQSPEMEVFSVNSVFEAEKFLCVYGYPQEIGSPPLTLTLTAPDGQSYTETFTIEQGESLLNLVNSAGEASGFVDDYISPAPVIMINLNFSANLPGGTWEVEGTNGDFGAGGSFVVERQEPFVSILDSASANGPFDSFDTYRTTFDTGDRVPIAGTGYTPNTEIVIAAYIPLPEPDPETGMLQYTAPFAATITTNANGNFQTEFIVGEGTMNGEFIIVADPFSRDWIDQHYGRFYVRELPGS
jgi:hypothetical protein